MYANLFYGIGFNFQCHFLSCFRNLEGKSVIYKIADHGIVNIIRSKTGIFSEYISISQIFKLDISITVPAFPINCAFAIDQ